MKQVVWYAMLPGEVGGEIGDLHFFFFLNLDENHRLCSVIRVGVTADFATLECFLGNLD